MEVFCTPLEFKANLIVRRTEIFCLTMIANRLYSSTLFVQLEKLNKTGESLQARICIKRPHLEGVAVGLLYK